MRRDLFFNPCQKAFFAFIFLIGFVSSAQILQVEILGGAIVTEGSTVTINAGSSIDFRMTNVETGNCGQLHIQDVDISNTTDFDISPNNPSDKLKPWSCNGDHTRDFEITNLNSTCATVSTLVTIEVKNQPDFTFTVEVNSSPEIYVLGGSPWADVNYNNTTTSADNGTYFGVVDAGAVVTRRFLIANIGSCPMNVLSATSDNPTEFAASSIFGIPFYGIPSYYGIYVDVTFTAPSPGAGTKSATISIYTNDPDTDPFLLNVSAEMFDFNIPGPGGVTADFRLWLKTTRGITKDGSSKVSLWQDLGSNDKDAEQPVLANQPTYIDNAVSNINFNPVLKFENDGGTLEQYMYNTSNGFYGQDMFIVMMPDATMTSASSRNTIFSGISSGTAGDMTGVGFGNYSSEFTNETLSYNQNIPGGGSYNGSAEISSTYSNAGIINVRNNITLTNGQDILYNSNVLTTSKINDVSFVNVGTPGGSPVLGTEYWIGRNFDLQGSLNGRIAEIFTFAERVTDADRQKVESYLAIKYGITLGASTEATKDYINSFDTSVWDVSANTGYNYHVAGIGRDSISDLNQKQSKTLNLANEVTISLGNIFATNNSNTNEFEKDGDFLVWGNNNAAFSGSSTNTVTIGSGITTSLTRIDRKWKIVESIENVDGDVEKVYVSIPEAAFSGFTKLATEEYALIVADNSNFANGDIIDVIPLRSDGSGNLNTWYDFDNTKFFTFGKTSKLIENHSINIASGDYLVGESDLNLNVDSFTISAWIKCAANASNRTVMAKGEKLQIRLNTSGNIEVFIDNVGTPKFTSNMDLDDGKWHHTTFVYDSGTILMYVDGILDKSIQDVVHPSPNYNNYCVGALYIDKNNIINPLLGDIDEIYVWDLALSETQIWYLMNQEVERFDVSGTDYVNGKILPQAALSNEVTTIPWSSLRVYYDFNSFYGSTVEGLTDDRFFLILKYLDKDKALLDTQTIPAPYVSIADGDWDTVGTWANGASIVLPNSLGLNGDSIDWNIVQLNHNIDSGDRDISVLGLIQTAGTLTMADPVVTAPIENNAGQALTISHYLELDGVIDLVGESQLIQDEGSIIDADSGGYLERDQQGTANGFNYNYWSSSVGAIGGNIATRGTGVSSTNPSAAIEDFLQNGSSSASYTSMLFSGVGYDYTPPGPPGLVRTIFTYWLYKFYGPEDDYNAWAKIDETTPLLPGEGFTMKGPLGTAPIAALQNYVFKGLPNNGDIILPLNKISGTDDVERLIGNPYPSAIDADEFILDNISTTEGGTNANTIINGALYFWDHFGKEDSHILKEYVGGYATYNLTGGAPAISNDARINNTSNAGSAALGTKVPGQYIPVNQGFFVSTKLETNPNDNGGNIANVDGGNIIFKNSQRIYETEGGATSVFFKSSNTKLASKSVTNKVKKQNPIIRLMYDSPLGFHRQIVIGTNEKASNNFDLGYDAFMVDVNVEDMYWNFNNNKFVIQGVNNFDVSQEFSLGVIVKKAGLAKIKVDALENTQTNLNLYIKDNVTNETHEITNEPFELYLEAGTYNDRFALVFSSGNAQSKLLSLEENDFLNEISLYFDSEVSSLKIKTQNEDSNILGVQVYSLDCKKTKSLTANSKEVTVPMSVSTGIYIVKCHTEKGIFNKKIIIK
jgi:hypothetical protein